MNNHSIPEFSISNFDIRVNFQSKIWHQDISTFRDMVENYHILYYVWLNNEKKK